MRSARRVQAGFGLKAEERLAVSRICHPVEGMLLAIELAAAWGQLLSCQEIAEEIERNLDFLATAMRDMPARYHSLRAAFDHSWNLFSGTEHSDLHLTVEQQIAEDEWVATCIIARGTHKGS